MRIETGQKSLDTQAWSQLVGYRFLLDGEEIRHCIRGDERTGTLLRYVTDSDGALVPDQEGQHLLTEELRGKVEIVPVFDL